MKIRQIEIETDLIAWNWIYTGRVCKISEFLLRHEGIFLRRLWYAVKSEIFCILGIDERWYAKRQLLMSGLVL